MITEGDSCLVKVIGTWYWIVSSPMGVEITLRGWSELPLLLVDPLCGGNGIKEEGLENQCHSKTPLSCASQH